MRLLAELPSTVSDDQSRPRSRWLTPQQRDGRHGRVGEGANVDICQEFLLDRRSGIEYA